MKRNLKTILRGSLILALCLSAISCSRDGELINTSDSRVINGSTEITEAWNTEAYSNISQTEGIITDAEKTDAPVSEETPHTIEDEHSDSDDSNTETKLLMPYDTPLEELCKMVHQRELPYDEIMFYPAFQDAVAEKFSEYTEESVAWEDLNFSVNNIDDVDQYWFWYQGNYPYVIRFEAGVSAHGLCWGVEGGIPILIFGIYSSDTFLYDGHAEVNPDHIGWYSCNGDQLEAVLAEKVDLSEFRIQREGLQIRGDNEIYVPLMYNDRFFCAEIEIDASLEYHIRSFNEVDINAISLYDFLITYRAFGLLPIDMMKYHIAHPLNPEILLSDYFQPDGEIKPDVEIFSGFTNLPYIRVRSGATQVFDYTYHLINRKTGQIIKTDEITEDISCQDVFWEIS